MEASGITLIFCSFFPYKNDADNHLPPNAAPETKTSPVVVFLNSLRLALRDRNLILNVENRSGDGGLDQFKSSLPAKGDTQTATAAEPAIKKQPFAAILFFDTQGSAGTDSCAARAEFAIFVLIQSWAAYCPQLFSALIVETILYLQ